jgi:hypothetical protein
MTTPTSGTNAVSVEDDVPIPYMQRMTTRKRDYLDLTTLSPATIAERRKEFDDVKATARAKREAS